MSSSPFLYSAECIGSAMEQVFSNAVNQDITNSGGGELAFAISQYKNKRVAESRLISVFIQ